jgi:hypothetical protein
MIWTLAFWKGAGERAIKTAAQTFVAIVGVTGVGSTLGLGDVPWTTDLSVTGVAVILSLVTSIGSADFTSGPPAAIVTPVDALDSPKHVDAS